LAFINKVRRLVAAQTVRLTVPDLSLVDHLLATAVDVATLANALAILPHTLVNIATEFFTAARELDAPNTVFFSLPELSSVHVTVQETDLTKALDLVLEPLAVEAVTVLVEERAHAMFLPVELLAFVEPVLVVVLLHEVSAFGSKFDSRLERCLESFEVYSIELELEGRHLGLAIFFDKHLVCW
jgi:hypothetical protein